MKCITTIIILFLSTSIGTTQSFGKVTKAALLNIEHATDSTANASYIFKKAEAYFDINPQGIQLVIEHHQRIKIHNEEGETYGELKIHTYRDGTTKESVSGIKAKSYNIVQSGQIEESKLSKKDIFTEKVDDNHGYVKFAMPNVKTGSVLDIKYTFKTPYVYSIPRFDFQEEIPIDYAQYTVKIPSYYTYTPIPTGYIALELDKKEVYGDYGKDQAYTYSANGVPAMPKDDYVLDTEDYRSSLKYDLYSSQFPNKTIEYYSKDWQEIGKDLLKNKYFGKELRKKTKELEPFIDKLIGLTEDEKISKIYSYVQDNFNWNGDYGISKDGGIKKLLKEKTGNIGDINLLFINMLNQADVDAMPFLTKPRHFGLLNINFPSRTELSYLLAYVAKGESYQLLDATTKFTPIGQLPTRAINISGILLNGNSVSTLSITNPNINKSTIMATYDIDMNEKYLTGSGKGNLENFAATLFRQDLEEKDDEEDDESENEDSSDEEDEEDEEDLELDDEYEITKVENVEDLDQKIKFEFDETLYSNISEIDGKLFIDATLDFGVEDNPFYEETREFPVFYRSLIKTRHLVTINLPEGYSVESAPENIAMALSDKSARFVYTTRQMNNSIVIDYNFSVNRDLFMPDQYPNLKELYNKVINMSKEKIILAKTKELAIEK